MRSKCPWPGSNPIGSGGPRCFVNAGCRPLFFLPLQSAAMSAATDKARFFLEQSVPELKEYERKNIFSKVETAPDCVEDGQLTLNARMKLPRSSRSGRTLSTSSMRAAPNPLTLSDMSSTR